MSKDPKTKSWKGRLCSPQAFVRLAILVAICPLLGLMGRFHWFLDLFNHLQAQYFVALLVITIVLALWKKPGHAAIAGLALMIPATHLAPLYRSSDLAPEGPSLRVAAYNVLSRNDRYNDAVEWILAANPDFIYLAECDRRWVKGLAPLGMTYPHAIDEVIAGNFGFGFRSKHPILSHRIHELGDLELPLLEAVVRTPNGDVTVFGCHPVPPVNEFWASERNLYLAELHRLSAAIKGHAVILGDLNATRWSYQMKPILGNYEDTQQGHGYSATWMRSNWLVTIPIDHILAKGFKGTLSRQSGPDLGSDHRPIVAELAW
ncbi:endonuclease/exonuclease/phosphatase family protein [Haloferula sp.]|uniref:endonuclease/exonuclease/phosphatase family protein n=1 Tax=Haloferula sp. TaxID=2497595 RepID=UPI003C75E433